MDEFAHALTVAIEAAREAGDLLRQEFHRPGGPRGSNGHAPIDETAEEHIRARLLAAFPWNYLGEERGATDNRDRQRLWLVDPNDGTSAYLKGWRGSAVSIAALRDGVPVLGVVHAFNYPDASGDLFAWAEGCPFTRNGRPVTVNLAGRRLDERTNPPPVVFVSQDADRNSAANAACVKPARYIALPSIAYRLARAAVGDGLAAVSLHGPGAWDYAAGHALLRATGGVLVDEAGHEVQYSPAGHSSTQSCFGGAPEAVRELSGRDWETVFAKQTPAAPPFCLVGPAPGRAVADVGLLSRAQGCLLGQLAGDALGGLVEFSSLHEIHAEYPHGCRALRDGGRWGNLAGQPTDDSEMALMLARTLVHRGRYDPGAALDAYVHWWPGAWDRGGTLTLALSPACRGQTTAERLRLATENANPSRESNGSLMRISPLGIFAHGQAEQGAEWARADSRLTHPSPVCQDACAVFVAALGTAIAGGGPEAVHEAALTEAARSNAQPAVRQALEAARTARPADYETNMGWAPIALQNAFYQLLNAPSLEEGVVDTVMHGGDTDTTAAIAGALLGAVHGRAAIPERWLQALLSCRPLAGSGTRHPRPPEFWPVDALVLAEALLCSGQARGG